MDYEKLRKILSSKGHAEEDRNGKHVFFAVTIDGKTYRATMFSHSARGQITADIMSQIARQMRLTTRELRQFVACPLSRDRWLELWSQRGRTWQRT